MSKLVKTKDDEELSDPNVVCFQAQILVKLGKISFETENNAMVTLFEILLALAIVFGTDLKSKASETLLDTCCDIVRGASEKLELVEENEYALKHLIDSKLMKWVCNGLNFNTTFKANQRKNKLVQMHTLMFQI